MQHTDLTAYLKNLLPEDFSTVQQELDWTWLPQDVFIDGASRLGIGDRFRLAPISPGEGIPHHANDHFKLVFVYAGSLTFDFDTSVTISGEQFLLVPPWVPFSVQPCSRSDIGIQLSFQTGLLCQQEGLTDLPAFSRFLALSEAWPAGDLVLEASPMALWYLDEMCCEHFDPDRHTYMMMPPLFSLLLAELDRCADVSLQKRLSANRITADEICRYIKTNYASATLGSTARRFGFSPNYLSHMLKEATGSSFQALKQSTAIAQSARLLLETDMTVAQIAQAVGIRNITHFYSLFSSRYGMTPAQYRSGTRAQTESDTVPSL